MAYGFVTGLTDVEVQRLIDLANSTAVQDRAYFKLDLDGDGHNDSIIIDYTDSSYQFQVRFGQEGQKFSPPLNFSHRYPTSRLKFNSLKVYETALSGKIPEIYLQRDPNGVRTQQLDWDALKIDYPRTMVFFSQPNYAHLKPAVELLMQSMQFRKALKDIEENGLTYLVGDSQNAGLVPSEENPKGNYPVMILSPDLDIRDLLINFPHELFHQYPGTPLSWKGGFGREFVRAYVQPEVEANLFAYSVLEEAGIGIDPLFSTYPLFQVYERGGFEAMLGAQKKATTFDGLIYAERSYYVYYHPDRLATSIPIVTPWTNARRQVGVQFNNWIELARGLAVASDLSGQQVVENFLRDNPPGFGDVYQHVQTYPDLWARYFDWFKEYYLIMKEGEASLNLERLTQNALLFTELAQSYTEASMERIRIRSAAEMGMSGVY